MSDEELKVCKAKAAAFDSLIEDLAGWLPMDAAVKKLAGVPLKEAMKGYVLVKVPEKEELLGRAVKEEGCGESFSFTSDDRDYPISVDISDVSAHSGCRTPTIMFYLPQGENAFEMSSHHVQGLINRLQQWRASSTFCLPSAALEPVREFDDRREDGKRWEGGRGWV